MNLFYLIIFYVDAEVSPDGHNWSTAAYSTDFVEKTWPTLYGQRGGTYDFEGTREIATGDHPTELLLNNNRNTIIIGIGNK